MDPSRKPSPVVRWERSKILGRGAYGTVNLGFLIDGCSRTPLAVKSSTGISAIALRREKKFLNQLRGCPQVIHCYGDSTTTNDEEEQTYYIFLEYAPEGSLHDYLRLRPMRERLARRLTRSMLRGLVHIHGRGVAHCDIKPGNVMIWRGEEVKIVDFGLAVPLCESNVRSSYRGTASYQAPECIARKEYGAPADIWALGCTLVEMLTGKPATAYLKNIQEYKAFLASAGVDHIPPQMPKHMSELGKEFLSRCFEVDTEKRWTAEMLLKHPYMAQDHDHVEGRSTSKVFRCLLPHEMCRPTTTTTSSSSSTSATKVFRFLLPHEMCRPTTTTTSSTSATKVFRCLLPHEMCRPTTTTSDEGVQMSPTTRDVSSHHHHLLLHNRDEGVQTSPPAREDGAVQAC